MPADRTLNMPQTNDPVVVTRRTIDVLYFLIAFRLLDAFTIRTFFQPDEYYQSLEPAWWLAFGEGSGAWITWVRKQRLLTILGANSV